MQAAQIVAFVLIFSLVIWVVYPAAKRGREARLRLPVARRRSDLVRLWVAGIVITSAFMLLVLGADRIGSGWAQGIKYGALVHLILTVGAILAVSWLAVRLFNKRRETSARDSSARSGVHGKEDHGSHG